MIIMMMMITMIVIVIKLMIMIIRMLIFIYVPPSVATYSLFTMVIFLYIYVIHISMYTCIFINCSQLLKVYKTVHTYTYTNYVPASITTYPIFTMNILTGSRGCGVFQCFLCIYEYMIVILAWIDNNMGVATSSFIRINMCKIEIHVYRYQQCLDNVNIRRRYMYIHICIHTYMYTMYIHVYQLK